MLLALHEKIVNKYCLGSLFIFRFCAYKYICECRMLYMCKHLLSGVLICVCTYILLIKFNTGWKWINRSGTAFIWLCSPSYSLKNRIFASVAHAGFGVSSVEQTTHFHKCHTPLPLRSIHTFTTFTHTFAVSQQTLHILTHIPLVSVYKQNKMPASAAWSFRFTFCPAMWMHAQTACNACHASSCINKKQALVLPIPCQGQVPVADCNEKNYCARS